MLLANRARMAANAGDTAAAKRDLKAAKRIAPDLEIYAEVEAVIKPQRTSWWRW